MTLWHKKNILSYSYDYLIYYTIHTITIVLLGCQVTGSNSLNIGKCVL